MNSGKLSSVMNNSTHPDQLLGRWELWNVWTSVHSTRESNLVPSAKYRKKSKELHVTNIERAEIKAATNMSYRQYNFLIEYARLDYTFMLLAIITLERGKIDCPRDWLMFWLGNPKIATDWRTGEELTYYVYEDYKRSFSYSCLWVQLLSEHGEISK